MVSCCSSQSRSSSSVSVSFGHTKRNVGSGMVVAALLVVTFCSSCRHAALGPQARPANDERDAIRVSVHGWVKNPGLYRLTSDATLESATRTCGGWAVRSDVERFRRVRIVRVTGGQTNELKIRISEVPAKKVLLRDGDALVYEAVLW